jgi:hypothetical protein
MSTALLYCGMSEGFVIGADGRGFNKVTGRIETDTERKIFPFEDQAVSVVFAWAGIVTARTPDFDFSLVKETSDLLPQLNFNGLFVQELNVRLKDRLRSLRVNTTGKCATGIFLSYLKGLPWVSEITVFKNGRTWDCSVEENFANGEVDLVSGPGKTFDKPTSLGQARTMIEAYLQECVANPTEEIGGHVHIGRLTPGGFDWILPPNIAAG